MKTWKGLRTSKKVLLAAISAILAFWIAETILRFTTAGGYSDTFTISWFTFWSVELYAMAGIKKAEIGQIPYKAAGSREDEVG